MAQCGGQIIYYTPRFMLTVPRWMALSFFPVKMGGGGRKSWLGRGRRRKKGRKEGRKEGVCSPPPLSLPTSFHHEKVALLKLCRVGAEVNKEVKQEIEILELRYSELAGRVVYYRVSPLLPDQYSIFPISSAIS